MYRYRTPLTVRAREAGAVVHTAVAAWTQFSGGCWVSMIPSLDTSTDRLPFVGEDKPYQVTLGAVFTRFVTEAPTSQRRSRIWRAFCLWQEVTAEEIPGARYWLSGSFLTDRPLPSDLDVVVVLEPQHEALLLPEVATSVRPLLTHRYVQAQWPQGVAARLQPTAGLVDAHVCFGRIPANVAQWQLDWTTEFDKTMGRPTGVRMGYLEVAP